MMQVQPFRVAYETNGVISVICPTLLRDDRNDKTYLIDAGYEGTVDLFEEHLLSMDVPLEKLTAVIISHEDIDHVGGLARLKELNPNIQVWSTRAVSEMVSGQQQSERQRQLEAEDSDDTKTWRTALLNKLKAVQKVSVDRTFEEGETIAEEMLVVATPGHTREHVSFFLPRSRVLIANDAIGIKNAELQLLPAQFTIDRASALESVRKLKDLHPSTVICYHGGMLFDDVESKLDHLLARYN